MRWIGFVIGLMIFATSTGGAIFASAAGWGLPKPFNNPVSIRQESLKNTRTGSGFPFLYFSGRHHYGGGYRGGK
ncbi:MAG: hypothetical protein V1754_13510 [Pseudomonadota bacterium]